MQGQRSLLAVLGGVAVFSMTTSALALEMSVPDGWYGEANGGVAHVSNANGETNLNGIAYNLNLGYKIMPYAAVEAGYTKYKNSKIDGTVVTLINSVPVTESATLVEISRYSFDIAAKGILPLADSGFEAFGKLGAQHIRARAASTSSLNNSISTVTGLPANYSSSANATGVYLGLGLQANIMSELAIVVQWQRAQGNNDTGNVDLFSLGVTFIFV